ncbi:MAG: glycosyltransferase involved in cell wall biosynthesis [Urechidicola sp.]|jgi:glycosyltransferase involved in cell wall biosynthesis
MKKLPISALVVTYNEGHLIEDCLKSIQFCEEIVVVDLTSEDNSFSIAEKWATSVLNHERVEIVEIIRKKLVPQLKYDWVLFTDPDERLEENIAEEIRPHLKKSTIVGEILACKLNYFKKKPLNGTVWGGKINSRCIINRKLATFTDNVHHGYKFFLPAKTIVLKKNNTIHHFWMQDYKTLFEKHLRYIENEGKSKYENGERYSYKLHFKQSILSFKECFYNHKGYLDGFTGLFLSFFWVWYTYQSWNSLKNYEQQHNSKK